MTEEIKNKVNEEIKEDVKSRIAETSSEEPTVEVVSDDKPKKSRKRGKRAETKVLDEAADKVVDFKKDANAKETDPIPAPENITLLQLRDYLEEGHTNAEIKKFLKDNNIIKDYVPYEDLVAAAHFAIDNSCFDGDGNFRKDMLTEKVFENVIALYVTTNIDLAGLSYEETYDLIQKYSLSDIIAEMDNFQWDKVGEFANDYLNDIYDQNYSAGAVISKAVGILNELSSSTNAIAQNPELAQKLIEVAQDQKK